MKNVDSFLERVLAKPEVRAEYEALKPEFDLHREMLRARQRAAMTQADVAEKMQTTPSAVARLESITKTTLPTLTALFKFAKATGHRLEIKFVPDTTTKTQRTRTAKA